MRHAGTVMVAGLLLLGVAWSSLFTIDETEVAIVTQFGEYKRAISAPGLNYKVPFVHVVTKMDRRVLGSDSLPSSYLTRDKKRLVVDPITRWRVDADNPVRFYTTVRDQVGARARLADITNSELRRELASRDFGEIVCVPGTAAAAATAAAADATADADDGTEPGTPPAPDVNAPGKGPAAPGSAPAEGADPELMAPEPIPPAGQFQLAGPDTSGLAGAEGVALECGRDQVMASVTRHVQETAEKYGIVVIDVRMKRSDLPAEVQESVYQRMKAERARVATAYRSMGEEEAQKIRADTDKQRRLILAEAYETAETLRGEGDGESIRIYAEAYGRDPEFYGFVRSLDAYAKTVDPKSTVVLSTGSPFFKYLENPSGGR